MSESEGGGGMYRSVRVGRRRSSTLFVILLLIGFAVVGWGWFICKSGFWDASVIDIQGLKTLNRGDVQKEVDAYFDNGRWSFFGKRNLLVLDEQKMSDALKERLFAENVVVDKSYPNVLRLLVTERQRSVVLVSGEQYVTVDTTGVVTAVADGDILTAAHERIAARAFADEIHLPVIVMPTADPLTVGFQAAEPDQVKRWIEVSRALVLGGVKARFMKIDTPESALGRFVSERGYDIYIDLMKPIEPQIATYAAYMRSKPDETKITEHVDVRVPGKVFTK